MRRTKVVSTLGPRSRDSHQLKSLIEAGTDVVRLNFAHDTFASHKQAAADAREQARRAGRIIGVLADLPGPKMRTGPVTGGEVELDHGSSFTLVAGRVDGDARRVSTSVDNLAEIVEPGDEIFLADGEIVLTVRSVEDGDVLTEVVRGGLLRSRKGLHLPGKEHRLPANTEHEAEALEAALELGADYVGLSFVRGADDLRRARESVPSRWPRPSFVAKIETAAALDQLSGILAESDAVMIARGDLGIQTPLRRVPLLQKEIIRACNEAGKPVITATEMLESMTREALPTRAEVTDVANAVVDGTDALMLSEETAIGDDPSGAVRTMSEIAETAESWPSDHKTPSGRSGGDRVEWAVADSAVHAAQDLGAAAIVCPARTGSTALRVAAFRPSMPVVALCAEEAVLGRLALGWGVAPVPSASLPTAAATDWGLSQITAAACDAGFVSSGDLVVVVAASGPPAAETNSIHILRA